ncbi:MAG: hypothetical protein ACR2LS_10620 [Thermomicrobiales bacterium]
MALLDWITLALGGVGVLISILAVVVSYWSYKANVRMAAANETMAESNRRMADSNEEMANSSQLAARMAREAADRQATAEQAKRKAAIRLVTTDQDAMGWSRHGENGEFNLRLRNEGQATAYEVRVVGVLTVPGKAIAPVTLGPSAMLTIDSGQEKPFSIPVTEHTFGNYAERDIEFRVSFRDGLGVDETIFPVRVYNYWPQSWSSHLLT